MWKPWHRADVLIPEGRKFRLWEVKAASSVKDYYLDDGALGAAQPSGLSQ